MIVVSDVDLTLIDRGATAGPACTSLFDALFARGVRYVLATSRPYASLVSVLARPVRSASYLICADGALAFCRRSDDGHEVIYRVRLDRACCLEALSSEGGRCDVSAFAFLDDEAAYSVGVMARATDDEAVGTILGSRRRIGLDEALNDTDGILSIGFLGTRGNVLAVRHALALTGLTTRANLRVYPELRVDKKDLWWCDVSSASADKGCALEWILAREKTSHADLGRIIALGDGENDVGLARRADVTFCPPWAAAPLKEMAIEMTAANNCEEFIRCVSNELRLTE